MQKFVIGPHVSIAGGYKKAGEEAVSISAGTFQFFTRNPRGGNVKALAEKDVAGLVEIVDAHDMGPLLAHAPYTLNMASKDEKTREFARLAFGQDLARLAQLPCRLYNFHPGSHVGQGPERGIELIVEILNELLTPEQETIVLLETMSGKGSEIGRSFEELRAIIDGVELKEKMGVCLDTCHVYSAGYDIVENLDGVIEEFDRVLGIERLKAIHLNDSLTPFASHKDRHARIGEGTIGEEAFRRIVTHPQLIHLPFFLETPQEAFSDYEKEVVRLRGYAEAKKSN